MTAVGNRISFDMVPGDCEVKAVRNISEDSSQMTLQCDMKTYPEKAAVTVGIKAKTNLVLHLDRGTPDDHLSDLKRKQYIGVVIYRIAEANDLVSRTKPQGSELPRNSHQSLSVRR
jgi:hypothetical protein